MLRPFLYMSRVVPFRRWYIPAVRSVGIPVSRRRAVPALAFFSDNVPAARKNLLPVAFRITFPISRMSSGHCWAFGAGNRG